MADLESKRCFACLQTKPTPEFNRDKSRRDGLQPKCRDCQKRLQKSDAGASGRANQYRQNNPEAEAWLNLKFGKVRAANVAAQITKFFTYIQETSNVIRF